MSNIEQMMEELLKTQKKVLEELGTQRAMITQIQEKVDCIESESRRSEAPPEVPPSLMRVLIGLEESSRPLTTEETADRISLSRNLVSSYLNRLLELGYVSKEPNLDNKGSRYRFSANYSAIPNNIKEILKKYNK
jgi:DNA-binding MarR family transcriptional regulator